MFAGRKVHSSDNILHPIALLEILRKLNDVLLVNQLICL